MKKGLILLAIVVAVVVVYFVFAGQKEEPQTTPVAKKEKPSGLSISKNPPAFNTAFSNMLSHYISVKDALINWDSTKAGSEARQLAEQVSGLPLQTLQADSSLVLTAKNFAGAIATESDHLAKAKTIADKRRAFSTISDNLYSLINTVRYDNEVIYYDMCPMAFNETEQGYWLSRDSAISNPYFGTKHPKYHSGMQTCGTVEQEINYAASKK